MASQNSDPENPGPNQASQNESIQVTDGDLLRALMGALPDRIYFKDRQSRFVKVSRATAEFFRAGTPESTKGKTDFDYFTKEHAQAAYDDEQRMMATGESIIGKIEKETFADGPDRWASTTKVPMRDQAGKIIGTFGISRDVTAQHAAEEKLAQYAAELAVKNAQMEKDMLMAREVQEAFLPQQYPSITCKESSSALEFSHLYLPSTLVGGDFFHVYPISEHEAGVLICDVMGHGVFAALITAIQRVLAEELAPMAGDPGPYLGELNRRLLSVLKRANTPILVTAFYLVIDVSTGTVRFANAGHPKPLHFKVADSAVESLSTLPREVDPALGLLADAVYHTHETPLDHGDTLMLYTDGLYDFDREDGKYLTEDTLPKFVQPLLGKSGEVLLNEIIEKLRTFAMGAPFGDDVCMVAIKFARKSGGNQFAFVSE